jgi:Leucine-rich repeat (LRR) protein
MIKWRSDEPAFLKLGRQADLDEETAFTICMLIDQVGSDVKEDWDWDWLEGKTGGYRLLIDRSLLKAAWRLLAQKDFLNLQTVDDESKRVTTITPLQEMTNLRTLGLQNNLVSDLKPLTGMANLKYLNCYSNRIVDLEPLANLRSLENLILSNNPIQSFAALERLSLKKLSLSTDQVADFSNSCKRLSSLQALEIECEGSVDSLADFPDLPCLKILNMRNAKDISGIERLSSLSTLEILDGTFSKLDGLEKLSGLTHLEIWTSEPVSLRPLGALYALRSITVRAPQIDDLSALGRLPMLHEIHIDDEAKCNRLELAELTKWLTPWADEFKTSDKQTRPSPRIEIVSQQDFDRYDSKESFGIKPGECEDGMFRSERLWLRRELIASIEALKLKEGDDADFLVTNKTGFERCEAIALYSLRAYEVFREIVAAIQQILCESRTDWIIYFQSLVSEGPDFEEVSDDTEDFIVWIYADKIVATKKDAAVIRELL